MPEKIFTFSDEEIVSMFKSGRMKLLTIPVEQTQSDHDKALKKAKSLFGKDFEDVFTLKIGGETNTQIKERLAYAGVYALPNVEYLINSSEFITLPSPKITHLVRLRIHQLGFEGMSGVTTKKIYQRAQEIGLLLCPNETGPILTIENPQNIIPKKGNPEPPYFIATEIMRGRDGYPFILAILYDASIGWSLCGDICRWDKYWHINSEFFFCLR